MTLYKDFVGIDIGKFTFVVGRHSSGVTKEYKNDVSDIKRFIKENRVILSDSLIVLETTGGYEQALAVALIDAGYRVHRADTRKVKNFIRSYGSGAKTDVLDARALARYGYERGGDLALYQPRQEQAQALFQLVQRRSDLTAMLVAEKNRLHKAEDEVVRASLQEVIALFTAQIAALTGQIKALIKSDKKMQQKFNIIKTVPGVGDVVGCALLALLPELGHLSRREIASLAGLAPRANDSGRSFGYRRIGHGRAGIKPVLFIAAMAARNSKTRFKEFYEQLIAKGKKKMVALTALMRKLLIVANAKLKEINALQ